MEDYWLCKFLDLLRDKYYVPVDKDAINFDGSVILITWLFKLLDEPIVNEICATPSEFFILTLARIELLYQKNIINNTFYEFIATNQNKAEFEKNIEDYNKIFSSFTYHWYLEQNKLPSLLNIEEGNTPDIFLIPERSEISRPLTFDFIDAAISMHIALVDMRTELNQHNSIQFLKNVLFPHLSILCLIDMEHAYLRIIENLPTMLENIKILYVKYLVFKYGYTFSDFSFLNMCPENPYEGLTIVEDTVVPGRIIIYVDFMKAQVRWCSRSR